MRAYSHLTSPVAPVRRDGAAPRACLRCKTVFQSEGFGERICARCKASVAWRSALPAGNGHRRRHTAGQSS